jgi:hypothetical protein
MNVEIMVGQRSTTLVRRSAGAERRRPAAPSAWRSRTPAAIAVLVLLVGALLAPACSENNGNSKQKSSEKRMVLSSGEYNKGYQDGKRDASAALIDANGAWMWSWMKGQEYSQGYDKGWSDGRQMKELQEKAKAARQGDEAQQPPPKTEDKSSRANVQPLRKPKPVITVDTKPKGKQ